MEDTRAEALPIGAAEAAAALQTLQRYKAGKAALDKRLIDNELWFRMGHWKNYRDPLMPGKAQPSSGWLFNSIANKHADAMDNYIPLIIFGPGVPQQQYAGLGMQVDVMPTLFGLMNLNYEYEGFGVNLLKQQRPMVFYSADNQIVARDHQRCFVYNPSMNRSFCYDVLPNGNLKETKQESKFQDLKTYVFSNIQAAEYIERHQQ